jgi:hypothetical protein
MKRIEPLAIVVLLCAGCRSPSPAYDPFMGRQTIPPPGTAVPPPGQPYYGAPPAVSTGSQILPPTGAVSPSNGPTNFAPNPAGGNGFSSFSPNVSPVNPASAPTATPGNFGRPAFTPVSSPAKPTYGPPGAPAYPQAGAMNPSAMNTAQTGVPKPLDVDRIIGPAPGQPIPATAQAAQWQASESAKKNAVTPAGYNAAASSNVIRVVEPATATAASRTASTERVPELTDLPPVASTGLQPIANQRSLTPQTVRTTAPATLATIQPASTTGASLGTVASASNVRISSYGHDPQYHWLKGKLEYSQSTRTWRLRYIPADEAGDQFGGSVKLSDAAKLSGFQNGDLVTVQGAVGNATAAEQGSFAPLYNIERIQKQ